MHLLVTGAAGMIGSKFLARVARDGALAGREVARATLHDIVAASPPEGLTAEVRVSDLAAPGEAAALVAGRPDVIVHLAAVVSGQAEHDFELGYAVNLDGTRELLEAVRAVGDGYRPRVIYASSIAVYGAPYPAVIPDEFHLTPLTSYGAQKAMGEFLLADYARRGFITGVGLRLPTICVRPGRPNKAASGFFSGILREPLAGQEAVLPVGEDVRHWFASPRAAVGYLLHAAALDTARLEGRPNLALPGVSATVGEQIAALRSLAGETVAARIRREPDPVIMAIVAGWAPAFEARRARDLGFTADADFPAILRAHVEDELGGDWVR